MGKGLIDKFGKGVRNLVLLGTAVGAIGFAGCKLPVPEPVNYAPKAVLQVAGLGGNNYDTNQESHTI